MIIVWVVRTLYRPIVDLPSLVWPLHNVLQQVLQLVSPGRREPCEATDLTGVVASSSQNMARWFL